MNSVDFNMLLYYYHNSTNDSFVGMDGFFDANMLMVTNPPEHDDVLNVATL